LKRDWKSIMRRFVAGFWIELLLNGGGAVALIAADENERRCQQEGVVSEFCRSADGGRGASHKPERADPIPMKGIRFRDSII